MKSEVLYVRSVPEGDDCEEIDLFPGAQSPVFKFNPDAFLKNYLQLNPGKSENELLRTRVRVWATTYKTKSK
jgi:hypothetical protein